MSRDRRYVIILILAGIISALSGIVGNIASSTLPEWLKPYLWLAWPLFIVCVALGVGLAVYQTRLDRRSDPAVPTPSAPAPTTANQPTAPNPPPQVQTEAPLAEDFVYDVFISYSSKDKAWVRGELLQTLEKQSLRVCIDFRDFRPGAPSIKEIERAITTSRKTLLILTPDYMASQWTDFEALLLQTLEPSNQTLRLIPLLKAECDLPLRLKFMTYVNFVDPDDWGVTWRQLLTALSTAPIQEIATKKPPPALKLDNQFNLTGDFRNAVVNISNIPDLEIIKETILEAIAKTIPAAVPADEKLYTAQVDRARDLLHSGNPVAAKQIIDTLSKIVAQTSVSNNLRFRIRSILGGCELELDHYQEASQIFEDALQYAYDSSKAIANVALAKLLQGDFEKAQLFAKQALDMQGSNETCAASVYAHAVASQRNFTNIDDLLNKDYFDNADYLRAMGFIFSQAKDFLKAEDMYRRAVALNENDAHSLVQLAQVLARQETEPLKGKVFASELEDDVLSDKLTESEELLDRAIVVFQKTDNRKRYLDALADRAGVRITRGNLENAAIDCEKVLGEDPKHVVALYNRAHVAHEKGDFKSSIQFLSAIPESEWSNYGIWPLLAKGLLRVGRIEDARNLLDRTPIEFEESHLIGMFVARAEVLLKQEAFEALENLKDSTLASHPNQVLLLEAAAYVEDLQQHKDTALRYSIEAHQLAEGLDRERLALRCEGLSSSSAPLRTGD